jgi:hypothetical protein
MRGLLIAAALYIALSFATYDGTISPPKDSPAIRQRSAADTLIYGSANIGSSSYYGSSGAYDVNY